MSSIVSIDTRGYDISMGPGVLRVGGGGGLAGNVYINGNVGIGVINPTATLEVSSTGLGNNTQAIITSTTASGASTTNTSTLNLRIKGAGGVLLDNTIVGKYFAQGFGTYGVSIGTAYGSNQNVLNVLGGSGSLGTGGGRVGINTTDPAATLDVNGSFRTTGGLELARSIANPNLFLEMNASSIFKSAHIDFHTGTTEVDWDSRIIADGGTGTTGGGNILINATNIGLNGTANISGLVSANGGFRGNRINLTAFATPTNSFYGSYIVFNNTIATNLNQTIPNATGSSSIIQLYSDTSVTQLITAGTSKFYGCGYDNSTTLELRTNEIVSLRSDGYNWIVFTDTNIIPGRRTFISRKADGTQTIPHATETLILFATDNGSGSQTGIDYTNANGRFTNNRGCTVVCNISGTLSYDLNGTGFRSVWINHSSLGRISITLLDATVTQPTCLTYSANIKLDDTEFFNIRGYQNSGAGIIASGTTLHPTTCTVLINDTC